MKGGQPIGPRHRSAQRVLRVVGPLVALTGLVFVVIGAVSLFSAGEEFGPPRHFWCGFVGLPLLFVGLVMTGYGFMGALARYGAGEIAPIAKDTFNYMAAGTSDGVRSLAQAVGEGLAEGRGGSAPNTVVLCHKCNAENSIGSRFCSQCGASLGKTKPCPACGELNDPDSNFCDNCGQAFG